MTEFKAPPGALEAESHPVAPAEPADQEEGGSREPAPPPSCGDEHFGFICAEPPGHDEWHIARSGARWPQTWKSEAVETELSDPERNEIGRVQADPHPTALAGAIRAAPNTGTQRRLVLDGIYAAGDRGLIYDEIAALPGVSDRAHRTRTHELVKDGWVEDSGKTRLTETRTDAVVWVMTETGRRQYERLT